MRRLVHLSDLHFGRARPELLEPLVGLVNRLAPDLVAISGDLTQRARYRQFREARAFIDRLEPRTLVVPGNHDVPLDNLLVRLLNPWVRYKRLIGRELEPRHADDELAVIGLNTVNPFAWQRGRIRRRTVRRVCAEFADDRTRTRIVVVHHPLEHAPEERKALTRGAAAAIDAFSECGADIVLSGHLHTWRAEPFAERVGRRGTLQVHAGTGLSTRVRGEENDFNLLTLEPGEVTVERYAAGEGADGFDVAGRVRFRLGEQGWVPTGE